MAMTIEDLLKNAKGDLDQFARVSHRLAMTESEQLEKILNLLLPRLLNRIGINNQKTMDLSALERRNITQQQQQQQRETISIIKSYYEKIHAKLVEMLSHIMKRVRDDTKCKLPCEAILHLLLLRDHNNDTNIKQEKSMLQQQPQQTQQQQQAIIPLSSIDPFTLNLALTFLTIGVPRSSTVDKENMLPGLLILIGSHMNLQNLSKVSSKNQLFQMSHLILRVVEGIVNGYREKKGVRNHHHHRKDGHNPQSASLSLAGTKRQASSDKDDNEKNNDESSIESSLEKARIVCFSNPSVSAALYDLLLDVLMYQTSATMGSNLPSPGSSTMGKERLCSGASTIEKNWIAEYATNGRLRDLKLAVIDFIAPCRQWDIFNVSGKGQEEKTQVNVLATARAVALMVVASGDQHADVSEKAASFLKAHMDSNRNKTKSNAMNNNSNSAEDHLEVPAVSLSLSLLGHPMVLTSSLLRLALGDIVADNICKSSDLNCDVNFQTCIGLFHDGNTMLRTNNNNGVYISTKRRMVSEKCATSILNFISSKILDDNPKFFISLITNESQTKWLSSINGACVVSNLVLSTVKKFVGTGRSLSGSSVSGSMGNASVAASRLLNTTSIRLVPFFEICRKFEKEQPFSDRVNMMEQIISQMFASACSIIKIASSAHSGNVNGNVGVEARDSGYLVLCTIVRCDVKNNHMLFNCGESSQTKNLVSIDTAKLLFGCVVNEADRLRPRAIAALDSLLGAYCRIFEDSKLMYDEAKNETMMNPWMQVVSRTETYNDDKFSTKVDFHHLSKILQPLIWNAAKANQPKASRHAAAKWAFEFLIALDINAACHILCFIAGDTDETAAGTAKEGLGLSFQMGEDEILLTTKSGTEIPTPDFAEFVSDLFRTETNKSLSWRPSFLDFSPKGKGITLRFGMMCLLSDLYGGDDESVDTFIGQVGRTLKNVHLRQGSSRKDLDSISLLDEASISFATCLKASAFAKQKIVSGESSITHGEIADLAITASSSKGRRHLAAALGYLIEDLSIWDCYIKGVLSSEVWLQRTKIDATLRHCSVKLSQVSTSYTNPNEVHGAAYLSANCIRALRLIDALNITECEVLNNCFQTSSGILKSFGRGLLHSDEIIGNSCAHALAISLSQDRIDAIDLNDTLADGCIEALKCLHIALKRFGNGDQTDETRTNLVAKASGVVLAATTLRRNLAAKEVNDEIGKERLECVDALFGLLGSSSFRKDPEMMLEVGEALGIYADAYSPDGATWSLPDEVKPTAFDLLYANKLPPHAQIFYVLMEREMKSNSPHKRNACAPVLLTLIARASRMAHKDVSYLHRAFPKEMQQYLVELQRAFLSLLANTKSKQLTRESCCIGLAACHGFSIISSKHLSTTGSEDAVQLNDSLLRAFGETTNHGGSALMESRNQNNQRMRENGDNQGAVASMTENFGIETEVGGTVGMGEAALGAYREMANAAVMLDRPDILYSLMLLSVSLPIWSTLSCQRRYSASSILGLQEGIDKKSDEIKAVLQPYMKNLIPRLLRACNDPNKQTREQMGALWIGLTGGGPESRALINNHLLSTIDALTNDATNKLWRTRVGACSALAEVIVGRTWGDLGGGGPISLDDYPDKQNKSAASRILLLYKVTIRALDDVRLTVRESGESLSKSLRSLTVRLCESTSSSGDFQIISSRDINHNDSVAASTTILPWLVKQGLNSPCQEAVGFSISSLLGIIEVAGSKTLEPVLPELVGTLLMAMSSLEPAALNYLQTRAAASDTSQFEQLERARLQMAQAGPIAGALSKCLDMVKSLESVEHRSAVIPYIDTALRTGGGFATRAAAADAVSTLCSQCPSSFYFKGSSLSNPTVRLLRALYFASEREQGSGARNKMIHAFGNLAALAPGKSVRSIALRLCDRYKQATGSNDDPVARIAVALALRAIAVRASNQFADGGSNDVWMNYVLPIAYLGRQDKEAGSYFEEVWDEGGQVANLSNSGSFAMPLEEKILPQLTKSLVDALEDASWERRIMACESLTVLCKKSVLAPGPRTSGQECYTTDDLLGRDLKRAVSSRKLLTTCVDIIVNTRQWNGKSNLTETTAIIAAKWVALAQTTEDSMVNQRMQEVFPLSCKNNNVDDLFPNDSMFLHQDDSLCYDDVSEYGASSGKNADDKGLPKRKATIDNNDMEVDYNNGSASENNSNNEGLSKRKDMLDNSDMEVDNDHIDFDDENIMFGDDMEGSDKVMEVVNRGPVTFSGLSRLLLHQGIERSIGNTNNTFYSVDSLSYRVASLHSLSLLLNSHNNSADLNFLFSNVAPSLCRVITGHDEVFADKSIQTMVNDSKIPPLIAAKAIICLGSLIWEGLKYDTQLDYTNVGSLIKLLSRNCGVIQPAWTVREAAANAVSKVANFADWGELSKISHLNGLIDCSECCIKDKRFAKVRLAKLNILKSLCSRIGRTNQNQLMLESLLPFKEKIWNMAKSSLNDSESSVSVVSSEIIASMSWWP